MKKKVLVTGGSGLVGTALETIGHEALQYEFEFSRSGDCDLTRYDALLEVLSRQKPQAILHLAAVRGGISLSSAHPATILRDNVLMGLHVLEAARVHNVGKVVMGLSSGMYPAGAPQPIKEECIHEGAPHESNYGYAFAKRLLEPAIRAYRSEFHMNVIGLVPNGIYGENDNFDEETSTFIAALIRRFYENRAGSGPIVVWGDGTPLRELTYSKDIARAFLWALDHYDSEQILNIGTSEEHSIREIAFLIADIMGIDKTRIAFDPKRPNGIARKATDNSKFLSLSGFRHMSLREGLVNTVRWFQDNHQPQGILRS